MVGSLKSQESGTFASNALPAKNISPIGSSSSKFVLDRAESLERSGFTEGSDRMDANLESATKSERWEIRLGVGQLIVLWSVVAGTMLMVFLFGLYAGREQGVQAALEGNAGEAMRMPIANDAQMLASNENPLESIAEEPTSINNSAAAVAPSEPANEAVKTAQLSTPPAELVPPSAEALKESSPVQVANSASESKPADLGTNQKSARASLADAIPLTPEKVENERAEIVKTVRAGSLSVGWYLQVAAARTNKEAAGISRKLRSTGLQPIVESAEVKGAAYYRVVLGPYPTKDAAWAMKRQALASKAARGEPFLKQVK